MIIPKRRWYVLGGTIVVLTGCSFWFYYSRTVISDNVVDWRGKSEVTVTLTEQSFQPNVVRITRGTKVTFTTTRQNQFWPASNPHPNHSVYPEFDPKQPIQSGRSWSFVFDKVGQWGYHDHVRSYFTGTIYVEE